MKDDIIADNYRYTKNITKDNISKFEKDLKKYLNKEDGKYYVVQVDAKSDTWSEAKRKISQVSDFLDSFTKKNKIIYDGDYSFQILAYMKEGYTLKELKDKISEKFKNSSYHSIKVLPKNKKFKVFKINPKTGLVSTEIKRSKLKDFKKKDNTIDKIYMRNLHKRFKWDKKSMDFNERIEKIREKKDRWKGRKGEREDIKSPEDRYGPKDKLKEEDKSLDKKDRFKNKYSKKVKEYFKFMQNQLKEMYEDVGSVHDLSDRDRKNFYRQVRKVWKKKKG